MKIIRLGTKILRLLQFGNKCNQLLSAPSSDNKPYYRLLVSRNVSKNYAVNIGKDSIVKDVRYCNKHTARSAEVDPPRTWTPSVGSRVRGCVILEYINRGQQWNTSSL